MPEDNVMQFLLESGYANLYFGELISADSNITNEDREKHIQALEKMLEELKKQVCDANLELVRQIGRAHV